MTRTLMQTPTGANIRGPQLFPEDDGEEYGGRRGNNEPRFFWPPRTAIEVQQMVQDAYA
jgi:hypothetical protein